MIAVRTPQLGCLAVASWEGRFGRAGVALDITLIGTSSNTPAQQAAYISRSSSNSGSGR